MEQGAVGARGSLPSVEELIRDAHGHLADLLQVASSILVEMQSFPSTAKKGVAELSERGNLAAILRKAGTPLPLPALVGAILSPAGNAEPAKLEAGTYSSFDVQSPRRRLPFIK
ncbi:unnamed protein product [Lampetra planeri]